MRTGIFFCLVEIGNHEPLNLPLRRDEFDGFPDSLHIHARSNQLIAGRSADGSSTP